MVYAQVYKIPLDPCLAIRFAIETKVYFADSPTEKQSLHYKRTNPANCNATLLPGPSQETFYNIKFPISPAFVSTRLRYSPRLGKQKTKEIRRRYPRYSNLNTYSTITPPEQFSPGKIAFSIRP